MFAIFTNTTPELIAIMIFKNTWYLIDVLLKNQPLQKKRGKTARHVPISQAFASAPKPPYSKNNSASAKSQTRYLQ